MATVILSSLAQADTILKCVDDRGEITFTQGRCPNGQSLDERMTIDNPRPSGSGPAIRLADPTPPVKEAPPINQQEQAPRPDTRSAPDDYDEYERSDELDGYSNTPPIRRDDYYPYPAYPYPGYGYPRPPHHPKPIRPSPPTPAPEPIDKPSVTERGRAAIEQKRAQIEAQKAERKRLVDER
jgi:hypothetical protein